MAGSWARSTAEQPATTYAEFKQEILNEIARCLNMPFNIAAGNSSRLQLRLGAAGPPDVLQEPSASSRPTSAAVLDRILAAWLDEADAHRGSAAPSLRDAVGVMPSHQWFWDGQEHVDPAKEANAQATRLQNNTTTLAYEYARQGATGRRSSASGPRKWR